MNTQQLLSLWPYGLIIAGVILCLICTISLYVRLKRAKREIIRQQEMNGENIQQICDLQEILTRVYRPTRFYINDPEKMAAWLGRLRAPKKRKAK